MILELQFVFCTRFFFNHCHVIFPYKDILNHFAPCHVTFSDMGPLSIFDRFVQKVVANCFSDSFVLKTTLQTQSRFTATSISQLLRKVFKNSLFVLAKTYEKYSVSKEYCIAHHDAKICFLPNCRYHVFLMVTLKSYCRNWTFYVSNINTWTVPIHCTSVDSVKILLSGVVRCSTMCKEQSILIKKRGVDRIPSIARRKSWPKSIESIVWAPSKRQNQGKPVDQSLENELNNLNRQNMNWN